MILVKEFVETVEESEKQSSFASLVLNEGRVKDNYRRVLDGFCRKFMKLVCPSMFSITDEVVN